MFQITVGYVSGIIAAVIFGLQFLLPNAAILILVGVLGREQNATTWSVVERQLASSAWPSLLSTDSAASPGYKSKLRLATWLRPMCFVFITVAAIVTPLGLYDAVAPSNKVQMRTFSYIADPGPMGYGTPPRAEVPFGRSCGGGDFFTGALSCPGTSVEIIDGVVVNDDYNMRIPKVLANLYQSGLAEQKETVSSFFDIQSRQYSYTHEAGVEHGRRYTVDQYRQLTTMVLNNALEPVEGLVVDTRKGGIGFRNHTVPDNVQYGAKWSEDLLFITPETQCVNLNVTMEYTIPWGYSDSGVDNLTLVDHGGFANINTTYPHFEFSGSQENPMLLERAYKAGWLTNALNMVYLNVTRPSPHAFSYINSKVGKRFPISTELNTANFRAFTASTLWQRLINVQPWQPNNTYHIEPFINYRNPFGITDDNYTDVSVLCEGVGGEDLGNISNIAVKCGLIFGAATRKDGASSLIFEPGTWYTQPVYSCASTNKASIKSVQFKYNTTLGEGLKRLQVVNVTDKIYRNDTEKPLWGVEKTHMFLKNTPTPLWGLISPELEHSVNLSTVRSERLYLPGYTLLGFNVGVPGYQSVPGTGGPNSALTSAYEIAGTSFDISGLPDYSGYSNLAMFVKWQQYSYNLSSVAKIMDLVWTDIAANALTGTKNWNSGRKLPAGLQKRDGDTSSSPTMDQSSAVQVPVTVYTHQIRYNWLFAIPAAIVLVLAILILTGAAAFALLGYSTKARVREYLFHLSAGRLLAKQVYPGQTDGLAPTKIWIAGVGRKHIRLHSDGAVAAGPHLPKMVTKPVSPIPGADHKPSGKSDTDILTKEAPRSPSDYATYGMPRGYIALEDRPR